MHPKYVLPSIESVLEAGWDTKKRLHRRHPRFFSQPSITLPFIIPSSPSTIKTEGSMQSTPTVETSVAQESTLQTIIDRVDNTTSSDSGSNLGFPPSVSPRLEEQSLLNGAIPTADDSGATDIPKVGNPQADINIPNVSSNPSRDHESP